MSDTEVRQAIVHRLRLAQRALLDIEALCLKEGVNFTGGVQADVGTLAGALDPDAVTVVRAGR